MPRKSLSSLQDRIDYSQFLLGLFENENTALMASYKSGGISLLDLHTDMRENLRRQHALQLITAAGGDVGNVDPNDWLRLGSTLKTQYGYLEDFMNQIKNGTADEAMLEARAAMYSDSSIISFWKQATIGTELPEYPGESCLGKGRCACQWVEKDGAWYWTLGESDHCEVCLENASKYNPYTGE